MKIKDKNKINPLMAVPDEEMMMYLHEKYPEESDEDIAEVSKAINLFKDMTDKWDYKSLSIESMWNKYKFLFLKIFTVRQGNVPDEVIYGSLQIAKKYFDDWYGSNSEYSQVVNVLLNNVHLEEF